MNVFSSSFTPFSRLRSIHVCFSAPEKGPHFVYGGEMEESGSGSVIAAMRNISCNWLPAHAKSSHVIMFNAMSSNVTMPNVTSSNAKDKTISRATYPPAKDQDPGRATLQVTRYAGAHSDGGANANAAPASRMFIVRNFSNDPEAQWARITKNPDVSTGPLACPFTRSLAPLARRIVNE